MQPLNSSPRFEKSLVPTLPDQPRKKGVDSFLVAPQYQSRSQDEPDIPHELGPNLSGGPSETAAFLGENQATDGQLGWLADKFGVDVTTLRELGVGYLAFADVFLFPERDHQWQIVGIQRHYRDGAISVLRGSTRGLILPEAWDTDADEIFIAFGVENVAALRSVGVNAIGVRRRRQEDHGERSRRRPQDVRDRPLALRRGRRRCGSGMPIEAPRGDFIADLAE